MRCQENRKDRAVIRDAQNLQREGFVRSMKRKRTNATRSTTEILLYAVGTAELGNVSETNM